MNDFPDILNSGILIKYFEGETSESENKLIHDWLDNNPENELNYKEIRNLWEEDKVGFLNRNYNPDIAWNKIESKISLIDEASDKPAAFKKNRVLYYILSSAAVFLLAFGIWKITILSGNNILVSTSANTAVQKLPDGSTVWLNKNSSIKYEHNFGQKDRVINLKGEAYFEVMPNVRIPFIIYVKDAKVEVTGTSFNVNANNENGSVEVVVKTGKVKVSERKLLDAASQFVEINAGEKAVVNSQQNTIEKSQNSNLNFIAWKTKILIFDQATLSEVIKTIENVYNITIKTDYDKLKNCKLVAKFDNQPVENILEILRYTFNLEIEKHNSYIVLKGKGCD